MILDSLSYLQKQLKMWLSEHESNLYTSGESKEFSTIISKQHLLNPWHSESDILIMLQYLAKLLQPESMMKWMLKYPAIKENTVRKPALLKPNYDYCFAGFHEWLSCIITQTPLIIHSNENQLGILKFLNQKLLDFDPELQSFLNLDASKSLKPEKYIIYTDKMNDPIRQYFKDKTALIIEPRTTIGIIMGNETSEDIRNFGADIFINTGQTSRSLRKIYVPEGYDIKKFIDGIEPFSYVYQSNKYANNYDYHQSVFLMNMINFLDNGFLIIKEDKQDYAPTGCLFYEYYKNFQDLIERLHANHSFENVICTEKLSPITIEPGSSHFFELDQYLNKRDLVEFLTR